jgi:leucyl-tRNA synthetase
MDTDYTPQEIEPRWQQFWQEQGLFRWDPNRPGKHYYCLMMYPYPSGTLHMGHVINYTIGDALVRYHLMRGDNVLSPMGWDSFGMPAENAAIKAKVYPADFTRKNIDRMREQMVRAGWGYDWTREVACSHPGYYRWTQWLFLQFYKAGLAYKKKAPVNWCPSCQTVLANEQVHEGCCERCATAVEPRDLVQWFFRMSAYAQRLLDGHARLAGGWPERVLKMQQEWIGRSEGARLDFTIDAPGSDAHGETLPVFTTRPDTIYGVTCMALAPEHPLVERLVQGTGRAAEVMAAVKSMRSQSMIERTSEESEKVGVFTGRHVVNPFDGSKSELWVTNYAVMEYGTGAVMAVPAHDHRDFLFARKYGLPIKVVIAPPDGATLDPATMTDAYVDPGVQVDSGPFDGMPNTEAIRVMTQYAKDHGFGDFAVSYRLKDWLLSRQRYWGAPIPIIYCDRCGEVPAPESALPVVLPRGVEFRPTGESPLARHAPFVNTTCPKCGGAARRETDTMDTFVDSSWYFLRYLTPRNTHAAFDRDLVRRWLPVDQYVGGIEHATMHLIYARFFTMVLHDLGLVDFDEPFARLFCQGMVCMTAHRCPEHLWLRESEVNLDGFTCKQCGKPVESEMAKMSKTKLNTVSPDELFETYGADTVHTYILSMAPPDRDVIYSEQNVVGINRFLNRVWTTVIDCLPLVQRDQPSAAGDDRSADLRRKTHQVIKVVTDAFEQDFHFNVAIARIMELVNLVREVTGVTESAATEPAKSRVSAAALGEALTTLVQLLAPFAPHVAEELWSRLGRPASLFRPETGGWPAYDPAVATADTVEMVVQVNGKVRDRLTVPRDLDEAALRAQALASPRLAPFIAGKTVRKVIVVPQRLVNIVV